uniref:Nonsense-mediated mRNA decay NMD3 family protein n=1 Tax=Arundo donax TaxID=35708 RepID=A0A0A9D6D1_ARUDO
MSTRARRQRAHMLAGLGCIATPHMQHSTVPTVAAGTNIPAPPAGAADPGSILVARRMGWIESDRSSRQSLAYRWVREGSEELVENFARVS